MFLSLILAGVLSLAAWGAIITGPCIVLGHLIARALVRLIEGK